jgi:hypothetical protein
MGELPTSFYRPAEAVTSAGSFELPPDLLAKSRARIERLALVMLVGVGLATLITQAFQMGGAARRMLLVLQVSTLVLNALVFWAARSRRLDHTSVLRLGLGYEVAQCSVSSLGEIGCGSIGAEEDGGRDVGPCHPCSTM